MGQILKVLIAHEQQDWLEDDDNRDLWMGNSEQSLTTKLRRILITQSVGEAYSKLNGPEYGNLRWRCFERTSCLITADGSDDHSIKVLKN